jgi:uncharacterized protein YjbI with pentapeptide repeats
MRIIHESQFKVGWIVGRAPGNGLTLSLTVKSAFKLKPDAAVTASLETPECVGDVYAKDNDIDAPLMYSSDFVPFKPAADILLVGTAYTPRGVQLTRLEVALRVGSFRKSLLVTGDRFWRVRSFIWETISAPCLFKTMPLIYDRAYGGMGYKQNPIGLGYHKKRLPNLESLTDPIRNRGDHPPPAGFGPVSTKWEPRRSKVGTYKGAWLKEKWPWFPDDFDWSYFNAAPPDQQITGYLYGDEELEFQNIHPVHAVYRSRLPGIRTRAFVRVDVSSTKSEFREVKLNLDTLWIDMESEQLILVWRGLTPVSSIKLKEISQLFVLAEPLSSPPCTSEKAYALMQQQMQQMVPSLTPEEMDEEAGHQTSQADFEQGMADMEKEASALNQEFAELEQEAAGQLNQQKVRLAAEGVDLKDLGQPESPETLAEIKSKLNAAIINLEGSNPQMLAQVTDLKKHLDELEKMDLEFAAFDSESDTAKTRESVRAAVAGREALVRADLSGLDLSGLDLSGIDCSGADFIKANLAGTKFIRARMVGALFIEANLAGADFSCADLEDADFTEATTIKAKFAGASISGASFGGLHLVGVDFSGCKGRSPNFSACDLDKTNFSNVELPFADFTNAKLNGADFSNAKLLSGNFGGASAIDINMDEADLTNLRVDEKANLMGGKFRKAKAPNSIWEGVSLDRVDFSCAILNGASFEDASIKEARFDRADLTKATFDDAQAQKAILTNANLLRASFNRANLQEASLAGSNLYEASFWEAILHNTNLDGANLKRTSIA